MKYFYIITRDKQIFELVYSEDVYKKAISQWMSGGLVTFGQSIFSTADISKILDEEQYDNYIKQINPKMWIKAGTWYDSGGFIKNEKWKQEQIEQEKKKEIDGDNKRGQGVVDVKEMLKKYKPDFLK